MNHFFEKIHKVRFELDVNIRLIMQFNPNPPYNFGDETCRKTVSSKYPFTSPTSCN